MFMIINSSIYSRYIWIYLRTIYILFISFIKFSFINLSKNTSNYFANISSVYTNFLSSVDEKPSPDGKSRNAMLDYLFHEYLFNIKSLSTTLKGPFSKKTENSDEHP